MNSMYSNMSFIKLAEELAPNVMPYLDHITDLAGIHDDEFEQFRPYAMPAASLAALGGLSTYGAIKAKRDAEKAIMDGLAANIRASELANQISDNARARELLAGKGGEATFGEYLKRRANPNKLLRDSKAHSSRALQSILKTLQTKKIL